MQVSYLTIREATWFIAFWCSDIRQSNLSDAHAHGIYQHKAVTTWYIDKQVKVTHFSTSLTLTTLLT